MIMRLLLMMLFIALPYFSFSQGYKVKVKGAEFPTERVPDHVSFPEQVNKFSIKKDNANKVPTDYIVQIGEEEHSFTTDGAYHEVVFSHDVRGLVVYILNDKRSVQGKPFILRKPR